MNFLGLNISRITNRINSDNFVKSNLNQFLPIHPNTEIIDFKVLIPNKKIMVLEHFIDNVYRSRYVVRMYKRTDLLGYTTGWRIDDIIAVKKYWIDFGNSWNDRTLIDAGHTDIVYEKLHQARFKFDHLSRTFITGTDTLHHYNF